MGMNEIESLSLDGLGFDTGVKEFSLKGGETIKFNPTDPNLIGRLLKASQTLDTKQKQYSERLQTLDENSPNEFLDFLNQVNDEMLDILGDMLAQKVSPVAFDGVGLYAYNSAGIPIWLAFMTAIMDRMEVSVKTAQSEQTAKIEKLMAKYKRK